MRISFSFVPPGGGKVVYRIETDLPSIPRAGDHVSIWDAEAGGTRTFVIRRTGWKLRGLKDAKTEFQRIAVEAEFALNEDIDCEDHKEACAKYGAKPIEAIVD